MRLIVRIRNTSPYPLPTYQTPGASGVDLYANLPTPYTLQPGERLLVPTGLYLEIPLGWEAQIRPRSGLALHYGITLLNAPGTIDADYRGEIQVLLINLGQQPFLIEPGMRIAQMVFCPIAQAQWEVVPALSPSERGEGGFGHTGT
jgi:dUTP pyrophosphatase